VLSEVREPQAYAKKLHGVVGQARLASPIGNGVIKGGGHLAGQCGTLDHKIQLGIEQRRSGVEIERADKQALAVHRKGLGVQAGGRFDSKAPVDKAAFACAEARRSSRNGTAERSSAWRTLLAHAIGEATHRWRRTTPTR